MTHPNFLKSTLLVAATAGILAGCTAQPSTQPQTQTGTTKIDQKVGDTTLSGTITQVGEQYMLTNPGQPSKGLDSYKVDLSQYAGQAVKVTGQYSGDTLFVSKVE